MFGLPLGLFVETAVAALLALTIGYCVVLNGRLKRLHDDRDALRQMVTDLMQATTLANTAIRELKNTAVEADSVLGARLEAAESFGVELANHVSAGQAILERIARITSVARQPGALPEVAGLDAPAAPPSKVQSALEQLAQRPRISGTAA
jgi:hypothetical protein